MATKTKETAMTDKIETQETAITETLATVSHSAREAAKLSASQVIANLVATTIESRVLGWKKPEDKPEWMQIPLAQILEPAALCMVAHLAALYFEGIPNREKVLTVCEYGMTASMKDAFDLLRPILAPAFNAIAGLYDDLPKAE